MVLFRETGVIVVCMVIIGINFKTGIVLGKDWYYFSTVLGELVLFSAASEERYYSQVSDLVFFSFKIDITEVNHH